MLFNPDLTHAFPFLIVGVKPPSVGSVGGTPLVARMHVGRARAGLELAASPIAQLLHAVS